MFDLFLRRLSNFRRLGGFSSFGSFSGFSSSPGCRLTTPDYLDDVTLGNPDDIQQRDVRRTSVEAASALDAIVHGILLQFVHHPVLCKLVQQERLQSHRAGLGTFAAAYAVALFLADSLSGREKQKG